ncbi:PKD domain-containing protein [Candidatus Bipolaricaulota bacterium]
MTRRSVRRIFLLVCTAGVLAFVALQGCIFFNRLPIARITASVLSGESPLQVAFDGTTSSDPDGVVTRYAWDFGDGGTAAGPTVNHVFISATVTTTFRVTLTVEDDDGAEAKTTQSIEVRAQGAAGGGDEDAPAAALRVNRLVGVAPVTILFDASGSTGGGGNITSYNWDFGDGTTLAGSSIPSHTFSPTETDTFLVTLFVWNTLNLVDTEQVEIIAIVPGAVGGTEDPVAEVTADPPLLLFESDAIPTIPSIFEVTFDPRGSSADAGHWIEYYEWDFGDGTLRVETTDVIITHVYELSAQTRTFLVRMTVYDDQGYEDTAILNVTLTQP